MTLDCLTMQIEYDIRDRSFKINGDVKESAYEELISEFLRGQIGAGADYLEPNIKDVYNITLQWHPNNDQFRISGNTGNKGLRDGILMDILSQLP